VRALEREKIAGIELRTAILPVDRVRGPEALIRAVQQFQPDAVLCLGEASRRMAISIERVAINLLDFRIADDLRKPFFQPGVSMHVVPVPLPKSRLVIRHELDAAQPFR
jgi:pyrrolidone-carboxylate peptidase